jgi:hypothetical protein
MATINLGDIAIPQADVADVLAALKAEYASNGIPNPTQAQCLEYLRKEAIQRIRTITREWRQKQVATVAPDLT